MKKVLSVWKTIILVISALIGVAGVTVLSLYLMGELSEEKVEPQDILFEKVLADGDGFYNESLSQFEVASDFKLTISTTTENVTEKKVALSLIGASSKADEDGYISDGVIRVKQVVEIGKPFDVYLEPTYNQTLDTNWIMGGQSLITATSSNVLADPQSIQIAVDCLVEDIDVCISGTDDFSETQSVVVGEVFSIDTKFSPTNSGYLYSDSSRSKEIFVDTTKSFISYDLDTDKFTANTRSGNEFDTITVYTFSNSYYQQKVLDSLSYITDREDLTFEVLKYFKEHPETCISKSINVKVKDVEVGIVDMNANNQTFSMSFDKYYTITANSASGNNTLGLSIKKDQLSTSLNNLFANVGIKLPVSDSNFANLSFEGGKIARIIEYSNGSVEIDKISYVSGMQFPVEDADAQIKEISYYLLPNTTPKSAGDYYWKFWVSSENNADLSFDLNVNFFYEDENSNTITFFDYKNSGTNDELSFKLEVNAQNQGIEEKVGWTNQAGIPLVINFEESGDPISATFDLSKEITSIPSTNLYQTVKYFILLPNDSEISADQIQNYFICSTGKYYTKDYLAEKDLNITNVEMPAEGYQLFEIDDSILTAKKSLQGKIYVVAATIKTYADGITPYIDDNSTETTADDKYIIVKISNAREVYVSSSLSIANMTPTFEFEDENDRIYQDDETGDYYVPSVVKNNSNEEMDLIKFNLTLSNCENFDTDDASSEIAKVLRAFNTPSEDLKLYIECDETTKQYVKLKNVSYVEELSDETRKIAVFEGILQIDKDQLETTTTKDMFGTLVKLNLVFEDGSNVFKKSILKSDDASVSFRIYNQQVCSIEASYEAGMESETVEVDVTSTGVSIKWGADAWQDDDSGTAISKLGEKLVFKMFDQFGQQVYAEDGIYKIKFEETSDSINKVLSFGADSDKIQNFNATNGATIQTELTVFVVEKSASGQETKVGKFAADGTFERDDSGEIVPLSSPSIAFSVKSEGVAEVWYDSYDYSKNSQDSAAVWTKSSSTSAIKISRYVTTGDEFKLSDSVKIFTSSIDPENTLTDEKEIEKVKSSNENVTAEYYFDPTFLSKLEDKGAALRKMFSEIVLVDPAEAPADDSTLEAYRGKKIQSVTFAYPFVDDGIQIDFKATGKNGSLFDITITFECVADLSISTSAFDAYKDTYEDYLVKDGNKISIFADQTFNLDEYAKLSSATGRIGDSYSWAKLESVVKNEYYDLSSSEIASIENGELKIEQVYDYTDLSLTLYYGPNTKYACSITLNFYINPNILVKQTNDSLITLSSIASTDGVSIESYYEFYKIVGDNAYLKADGTINTETGDKAPTQLSISGNLSYINESTIKYININSGKVKFAESQNEIDFKLGQSYNQSFSLTYTNGTIQTPQLKAVKITNAGEIELNTSGVRIEFDLGYEKGENIFTDEEGNGVETVTYGGTEYLLLLADSDYAVSTDYTVVNYSGLIRKSGDHGLIVDPISQGYFSVEGNMFELSQTFKNSDGTSSGTLTATILFRAIVSGFGDKFVYYNNSAFDANKIVYNSFVYENADKADLKEILEISNTNIYQILDAGEYIVVHDTYLNREYITKGSQYYLTKEDAEKEINSKTAQKDIYFGNFIAKANIYTKDQIVEIKVNENTTYYIKYNEGILGFGKDIKSYQNILGFYFDGKASGVSDAPNDTSVIVTIDTAAQGYVDGLATLSKVDSLDNYDSVLKINNVSKEYVEKYGDVFVTLKFEIYKTAYPSQKFEMYYRIKVNPSYTLAEVTYPYSDNEEYLSETHANFDGEQYVVDLTEEFDETNSKYSDRKRFADAYSVVGSEKMDVVASYQISSIKIGSQEVVQAAYFKTLEIDENGMFTAKLLAAAQNSQITVVVTKTLSLNDQLMIGSARDYVFKFNQGSVYEHSLSATINNETDSTLTKSDDDAYTQSITAGCGEIIYTADIKIKGSNNSYTNVSDYTAYVKMLTEKCGLSDALMPVAVTYDADGKASYSFENAKYTYSVSEGTIGYYDSDKTTTSEIEVVSNVAEEISGEGFTGYTLAYGETYYFKNSDLTKTGSDGNWTYKVAAGKAIYLRYVASEDLPYSFTPALDLSNEYAQVDIKIQDKTVTAYIKSSDVMETTKYYYLDDSNKLHFKPLDSISQDMQLEIGYYTSERVVFKVIVDLKSYFVHELNNIDFIGGKEYSVSGDIFKELKSSKDGVEISSFKLELKYADEIYLNYNAEGLTDGDEGWDENKVVRLEELISSLSKVSDLDSTITFAHLPQDAIFKFTATINNEYSFEFELLVAASVSLSQTRISDNTAGPEHYTNEEFKVSISNISSAIEFYKEKYGTAFVFADDGTTETSITYTEYSDKTVYPRQQLEVAYKFNDNPIFTFNVEYRYKVVPSVAVEAYHPAPDGTKEIAAEYISTTAPTGGEISYTSGLIDNFFNSAAQHALIKGTTTTDKGKTTTTYYNRIDITDKTGGNLKTIGENWTIVVSEISNVKLKVIGKDINKTISSSGTDRTILENCISRPDIDLTFEIENSQSEGSVSFLVTINGVSTEYNVIVCLGSAYSVSHAAPNYTSNKETIYAEDLANQELNIFAQDRIASFVTKEDASVGTYYLRFVNKQNTAEVITPSITISSISTSITNIDLGQSFKDYNYEGTFSTKDLAKTGLVENKLDSKLYANGMNITNRFIVSYGGVELKLSDGYSLQLKQRVGDIKEDGTYNYEDMVDAAGFKVSTDDYATQTTVEIYLYSGSVKINLNSIYSYYLDLELEVNGAANDISGYETHILQANGGLSGGAQTPYQLMNVVDIYNKRTNTAYGTTGLANSAGTIDLQIYGFETLQVKLDNLTEDAIKGYLKGDSTEVKKLQAIAGYFHNMLINSEVEIAGRGSIKYYTGLIPTYRMTEINSAIGKDFTSYDNYISIAGSETGKTTDYKLYANASNNDGNHVMMRLAYTVDINGSKAGGEITRYFNLLFKVESNAKVSFATGYQSSSYVGGAEETVDGKTIISNYQHIYSIEDTTISGEDKVINLVGDEKQAWKALMYGASSDSADEFEYKITLDTQLGPITYNDYSKFKNWLSGGGSSYWKGYTETETDKTYYKNATTTNLKSLNLQIPQMNLGSRNYMVEIENKFGYKVRFYCQYVSAVNPQILSMTSTTLTENTNLAFLSNYNEVTGSYYNTSEHLVGKFVYQEVNNVSGITGTNYYNNTIKVENNTGNTLTIKAYIEDISVKYGDLNTTTSICRTLGTVSPETTTPTYLSVYGGSAKGYTDWTAPGLTGTSVALDTVAQSGTNGVSDSKLNVYLAGETVYITVSVSGSTVGDSTYTISNPGYLSRWVDKEGGTKTEKFVVKTTDGTFAEQDRVSVTTGSEGSETTTTASEMKDKDGNSLKQSLSQTYTVSQESTKATIKANDGQDTTQVVLTGLSAVGFGKDEATAIDKNSLTAEDSGLISQVADVYVDSVDFYYNDEWLGGSWASTDYSNGVDKDKAKNKTSTDKTNEWTDKAVSGEENSNGVIDNTEGDDGELTHKIAPIITSDEMYFASKDSKGDIKIKQGQGGNFNTTSGSDKSNTDSSANPYIFKVPYISGILYGTGSVVSNVTMNVTLRDINNNTTTISKVVSINRRATTSGNFANNNIQDGTSPVAKNSLNDTGAAILNDTLEVTLKAKTSVTFMVHNNEISNISTDLLTATVGSGETATTFAPKLITLTNSNAYQVTKYVGISASIVGLEENLKSVSRFYVYVLENDQDNPATFAYNGSKFSTDINAEKTGWTRTDDKGTVDTTDDVTYTIKGYKSTIGTYGSANALKLRFSTVDEVLSSNSKTEKLFFLYSAYGETYQFVENFNVYPLYTSAETSNGTNKIIVDDYMIATKGGETYYMVSLSSWANDILLYNKSVYKDGNGEKFTSIPAYKFYFKISEDMGGSAFIDENGLITTNTTYNIKDHQMAVDVYMKVSGPEGNFEDINQKLLIGTFIINLNPASSNVNSIRFAKENKTDGYGQYNNDLISLASNTTLTGSSSDTISNISDSDSDSKSFTFSTPVGESLNLKNLLDEEVSSSENAWQNWTNKNYHIVSDTLNGGTTKTYLYYNNLNSWTFSEIGTHTIEVVVSGRASSGDGISYKALKNIQVVVYDNKINEENIFDCPVTATTTDGTTTYGVYTHTLDSDYTWYLRNDDGSVEALTSKTIDVNKDENKKTYTGIIQKKYIAVASDGTVKNVVYTYYVYEKVDEKSVALTNTSTLKFESLIDNQEYGWTYTFYDENYEEITQESYTSYGQNSTLSKTIYMQAYNDETKKQSLTKIKLTIKIISSDVTQRLVVFNGDLTNGVVETELKAAITKLSNASLVDSGSSGFLAKDSDGKYTNTSNVWTYEILDGQVLKENSALSYTGSDNKTQYYTTFLVSYRAAGSQKNEFYRFVFTYYQYQGDYYITQTLSKSNNNYPLTNLNDLVKELCDTHNSSAVRYFTIEGEKMVEKTFVDVENSHYGEYYVLINNVYYKFTIALFGKTYEIAPNSTSLNDVESAIKDCLDLSDGSSVEIYIAESNGKLTETTTISSAGEIYAKVEDVYYKFEITTSTATAQ